MQDENISIYLDMFLLLVIWIYLDLVLIKMGS